MKEDTVAQPADKDKAGGKTCSKCGGSGSCPSCNGFAIGCGPCNYSGECPACDGTGIA